MDTSPEQIRDIAVRVVEDFINNKVPLSEAVAEASRSMCLNSEQIKRVVEAANSIAYLKLLENSEDRTFEFPVAEYSEVMGLLVLPEEMATKAASVVKDQSMSKEAQEESTGSSVSLNEKYQLVFNEMTSNKAQLEKLAYDLQEVGLLIESSMKSLKKDSEGLEKLAGVAEEYCYNKVSMLMHGMVKEASTGSIYRDSELYEARNMSSLFKQAESILTEKLHREEMHEKMAGVLSSLAGKAIGGVFKGTGKLVGGGIGLATGAAVGGAGKLLGSSVVRKTSSKLALPILGGIGLKAKSGPDVWDALQH